MVQTAISGTTPYCTPTQLVVYEDYRTPARLGVDSEIALMPTLAEFLANPMTTQILMAVSGDVEKAVLRGGRYTKEDLQALAGTNAGESLAKLIAHLAVIAYYERRGQIAPMTPDRQKAIDELEALKQGDEIFPFQESADAGRLSGRHGTSWTVRQASGYLGRDVAGRFGGWPWGRGGGASWDWDGRW